MGHLFLIVFSTLRKSLRSRGKKKKFFFLPISGSNPVAKMPRMRSKNGKNFSNVFSFFLHKMNPFLKPYSTHFTLLNSHKLAQKYFIVRGGQKRRHQALITGFWWWIRSTNRPCKAGKTTHSLDLDGSRRRAEKGWKNFFFNFKKTSFFMKT